MNNNLPPKWANWILEWFCSDEQIEVLQGDLHELYSDRLKEKGKFKARFFFVIDVLDMIRPFAFKKSHSTQNNNLAMYKNYLIIAYRNFFKQKVYSLINTAGLAIGLACFILIFLFINDELSYDRFHVKSDRTYRLVEHFISDGVGEHSASQPFPVGPTLKNDFPEMVAHSVRMFNFQSPFLSVANVEAEKEFNESRVFYVDSTFFDVFDFQLLTGDKKFALDGPNSILITESMAKKYFGDLDPMGKILQVQGAHNYEVKGVLADAPLNAHFQFDFLVSFSSLRAFYQGRFPWNSWYWNPCWTYLVLDENISPERFSAQLPGFVQKYFQENIRDDVDMELQPLEDIHLTSKLDYEIQNNSNESNIYVFSMVAIFVLLIAMINFINLSTARATKRAKEVGIRKSLGSVKKQLVQQFLFESVMHTLFALFIALISIVIILPAFNQLTEKSLELNTFFTLEYISVTIVLTLIVGIVAGFYPAFILSSFKTTEVLKGEKIQNRGMSFRKVLVVLQFSISMVLIVGTIVAIEQLELLQNDDLGFDKEAVLMIPVIRTPIGQHFDNLKNELLNHPGIRSVTAVEEVLGAKHQVMNYQFDGMDNSKPFPRLFMRYDFLKTFDIPLVAGRAYERSHITDDSLALIVNEAMVKQLGYGTPENALGKSFNGQNREGKIIGVVKDFNFMSKHHPMSPLAIDLWTAPFTFNLFMKYMAVKVDHDKIGQSILIVENTWRKFMPNWPMDYFLLDDRLKNSYKSEIKLSKITTIFSVLAIFVACLGLFGLATYTMELRTKEIGIRKVLGIGTNQIILLLSKDFMLLLGISFVIAVPLAYYMIEWWLEGFAYRIEIVVRPFIIAGMATFLVAMTTVGFHSLKASMINPVKTLKCE